MPQTNFAAYDAEVPKFEGAVRREETRLRNLQLKHDIRAVNNVLWEMGRTYHATFPRTQIYAVLMQNGFENFGAIIIGTEGRFTRPVGRDKWISISYFTMPSGRLEVVAYVS